METRNKVTMGFMAIFAAAAILFLVNVTYFAQKDRERLMAIYGVDSKTTRLGPNFLVDYYREHIQPASSMDDVHKVIRGYNSLSTEKKESLLLERYTFRVGLIDSLGVTVAYDARGRFLGVDDSKQF